MAAVNEMRRQRRSTFVRLATFFAITGLLTFLIGSQIARISFGGGYQIVAVFDDATGLMRGDVVKIAGAPVGQVDSIEVEKGKARVELTVEERYRVPADSEVAIRWRSAVGQRVVYLIPGTAPEKIKDGAKITKTRSVVDIGELVDQIAPLARSLDPERLNQILTAIYEALNGNRTEITQLISDVDQLSSTIAARRTTLKQMLQDYTDITEVLARRDGQIRQMTDNLVELSDAFVRNRGLLDDALVELSKTFQTSDALLTGNSEQLDQVIGGLAIVAAGVQHNLGTVDDVLKLTGPKLQRLFSVFNDGEFAKGGVACLSLVPGQCPYPVVLKDYQGKPQSPDLLRKILIGGS
ncbi:phospholipid/cholesterol/gamma-HCH transport system substrate-binding protein [Actinocorallia herbida]|uniref:Phospholipid/cholesterol/gamma-HCH transport system substrate-binding protein n=1 Tax=Actinocorallia herbida TaxID=58109 RepID=A0A3N1D3Y7_9ACTN|nr:MlaD family protein [Actinocorallia herbida]ROO88235.1 phospholipid/cholesterol/gamma-HCH transport system substrate-binding protein [Actinocorallia herbida]